MSAAIWQGRDVIGTRLIQQFTLTAISAGLGRRLASVGGICPGLLLAASLLFGLPLPASGQTVTPASVDFGGVQTFTTFQIVAVVLNNSESQFNLGEVDLSGTDSTSFALASGSNQCQSNTVLAVNTSCNFYISFSPTSVRTYSAELDIEDLDSGVSLSGTGISFNEPVGSSQAAQQVSVMIQNADTPANINVLTWGDAGPDFTAQSGGSCSTTTNYAQGAVCTVNVGFSPQFTGTRYGAILLTDSEQGFVGLTFLAGFGTGAQIIYNPVTPISLVGFTTGLGGIAADAGDNLYYYDGLGNIQQLPHSSSGYGAPSVINNVGETTFFSLAIDGAGDILLGLESEGDAFEINSIGPETWGSVSFLSQVKNTPNQIVMDSLGNYYYLDDVNGIFELPYTGGSGTGGFGQQVALPFPATEGWTYTGIAVDPAFNVYAIQQNTSTKQIQLVFLPYQGAGSYGNPSMTTISQFIAGGSVAVDAGGDVYVSGLTSSTKGAIYYLPSNGGFLGSYGTPMLISTGLYGAFVLDGAGNIFALQANASGQNQIVEIPQATPPSLTFATTAVGSTSTDSPQNVTVISVGDSNSTLDIGTTAYPTDFPNNSSASNQCNSLFLEPGETCTVSVNFTPTVSGALAEDVVLSDNALNVESAKQNIPVGGNATEASPTVTLTGIDFGNQTENVTSAPMAATLTNTSSSSLTIYPPIFFIGSDPGDFALASGSNACGTTLAGNSSCSIWVTFTPSMLGAESAELYVSDNATGSPQIEPLTGTGVAANAPGAQLSPSIAFGNQAKGSTSAAMTAKLTNTGNATLNIASITMTGANAADFAITTGSNACGSSLSAGSNCLIYVTFKPSTAAAETATLDVKDNAAGSPQTSELSGTGTAPGASLSPAIAFGNEPLGSTTAAMTATLTNTGNATLSITGITVTGANAADFAVATGSNACGSSLGAGLNCLIYVTFKPSTVAAETATLNVADNAAGSPQTSALTGTGTATEGDFAVASPTAPQTVQPGGSAQYTINVSPTPQGDFFNNAVALTATGLPPGATASFNPSSVTPGSKTVPSTMTVQVPSTTAELRAPLAPNRWPILPTSLALGLGGAWAVFRRRRRTRLDRFLSSILLAAAFAAACAGITSCGGGFALMQPTTYTITVTGTSGETTHTTTVQLTVQ